MSARRSTTIVVGILLLLAGTVFALQGANVIGGSSAMNGSSTWIYVGGLLAVIGLLIAIMGFASKSSRGVMASGGAQSGAQ